MQNPIKIIRLPWLDPIKGLAILGIVLYHATLLIFDIPPFDHPKDDWLPLSERLVQVWPLVRNAPTAYLILGNGLRYLGWLGYQGVHLFIILSGFGLAWSQLHRAPGEDVTLGQFYRRRLWRLLPIYWAGHFFFLLFQLLIGRFLGQPVISLLDSRFYLSLAGVRFLPETFFYISPAWWYFGLILQLYLAFPLLWTWLRRKGMLHFWLGTAAITLCSRFVLLIIIGSNIEMWSMGGLFVTRLFEFTFGMGLAYWLARQPNGLDYLWQKRWPLLVACLAYLLALALSFIVLGSIVAHSLIAVSLFGIAYIASQYILLPIKPVGQIISWLGVESYAIMILHQPTLWWFIPWARSQFGKSLSFFLLLGIFLILIVIGSAVFRIAVESISRLMAQGATVFWSFVVNRLDPQYSDVS